MNMLKLQKIYNSMKQNFDDSIFKKIRDRIGAKIITCLLITIFATMCFLYLSPGFKVTITPTNAVPGSIVFRGALVDGNWFHGSALFESGNWKFAEENKVCVSVDTSPMVARIPYGKEVAVVFTVGPNQGVVEIEYNSKDLTFDCWNESLIGNGGGFFITPPNEFIRTFIFGSLVFLTLIIFGYLVQYFDCIKKDKIFECLFFVSLIPLVFSVIYNLSLSSTPKIPEEAFFYGWSDAAVYKLLGKGWLNGLIPYKDIFEQKGPLIFFVYMLGEWIDENWGVFLIQTVSVWVSIVFSYYIAKVISGKGTGIIASLATLFFYALIISNDEGALVEDFNLPFLMVSTYLVVKYYSNENGNIEHPARYAFMHGITFGASLCLRITNCIAICCFVFCITVSLLAGKKLRNLFKNIGTFLCGVACVILPFIIYFWSNGALSGLADGYLFQFQYTVRDLQPKNNDEWKLFLIYLSPVLSCALLSFERKQSYRISMVISAIAIVLLMNKLSLFDHYYIAHIIFVPVALAWFILPPKHDGKIIFRYKFVYLFFTIVIFLSISNFGFKSIKNMRGTIDIISISPAGEYVIKSQEIGNLIPEDDRDKVLGYNLRTDWWLINDLFPCQRFYGGSDWGFSVWPKTLDESVEFYSSLDAEWIVTFGDVGCAEIADIINRFYVQTTSVHIDTYDCWLTLYQKKVSLT